ncbi:MAG TPA: ABC transporter permease subunit [Thermoplasmata archaeon]|nr:ABC transporter permease subunit [Thermoplasmata archaeon]
MAGDRESTGLGRFDRELLAALPVVAFVAVFTLLPVALLFAQGWAGVSGGSGVATILGESVNDRAISNSLIEGAVSALAAVAVGYPSGVFLGRTHFPGRSVVLSVLLIPFLLPTVAVVLGVVEFLGPGGLITSFAPGAGVFGSGFGGIVAANVVFNAPVVVLLTVVGVETASPDLEETVASLGGSPRTAFRSVWGPPSLVGALAGGLVAFLFSALAFAGPLLIGGASWYTIEARVYTLAQTLAQGPAAAVLALAGVALLTPVTVAYIALSGHLRAGPLAAQRRIRRFDGRNPIAWGLAVWTAIFVGGVGLLLGEIVVAGFARSGSFGSAASPFVDLFAPALTARLGFSTASAGANTLLYATLASVLAVLLALAAAPSLARRRRAQRAVGAIAFAPLLISPVVLSFALAQFVRPLLGGESAVPLLIIISQATLALPFVLQAIGIPLTGTSPRLGEAARALGASRWQAYLDVELPTIRSGIWTAGLFAFALGLGEFTATNFLATATASTLPVEIYHLEALRLGGLSRAAAALLVLLCLGLFVAIATRREEGSRVF